MDFEKALKEYDEQFIETHQKEIAALSKEETKVFDQIMKNHIRGWIEPDDTGFIGDLNDYFDQHYARLVRLMVREEFREDLRYMLGKFCQFQYAEGGLRRSFRSKDYSPFLQRALSMVDAYYLMGFRQTDIKDMGKYVSRTDSPFGIDISRCRTYYVDPFIIAARIDRGDKKVIDTIKEMMNSERNTEILTVPVIRAVFCCDNMDLHELMCKLLVAARLSEGLRQAICENCDCGTADAFIRIVKTIQENDLVRFSSVKRAIGTWTGLCRYEGPDRLAGKILDDIPFVLESEDHAAEKFLSSDPVDIYMGLWGIGFYDVSKALDMIRQYVGISSENIKTDLIGKIKGWFSKPEKQERCMSESDEIHLLTIGYFCQNLGYPTIAMQLALSVMEQHPDNYRLFSVIEADYPFGLKGFFVRHFHQELAYFHQELAFNKKVHKDRQLAARHYEIMRKLYEKMPQKEMIYAPLLYPWFSASISKSRILSAMLDAAVVMEDDEKIDRICENITGFDPHDRAAAVQEIGSVMRTRKQRETIINAVADKESVTRRCAVEMLSKTELNDSEYQVIEGFSRFKTADLRSGVIRLLQMRQNKELEKSIIRMLSANNENIRLASLDLLQYGISTYPKYDFSASVQAALDIPSPTEREQILINKLTDSGSAEQITKENGYGLYDPKASLPLPDFKTDIRIVRDYCHISSEELNEMFRGLLRIVDENSEREFKNYWGEERLLGNMGSLNIVYSLTDDTAEYEKKVPFYELWNAFYEDVIQTPQRFFCFAHAGVVLDSHELTDEAKKKAAKNIRTIFGEFADYDPFRSLEAEDERFGFNAFRYLYNDVCTYLQKRFELKTPMNVLQQLAGFMSLEMKKEELWLKKERASYGSIDRTPFHSRVPVVHQMLQELYERIYEDFDTNFRLLHTLAVKTDHIGHYEHLDDYYHHSDNIPVPYYIKAYQDGIIDRDIFLFSMFRLIGLSDALSELNVFVSNEPIRFGYYRFGNYDSRSDSSYAKLLSEEGRELCDDDTIPQDSRLYQTGNLFARTILDKVLDVELKRGDSETVFSKSIKRIRSIYGLERLIDILKALGNETLKTSYYSREISKKDSLSHLLSVCFPAPEDNAEKLGALLKGSQIKKDRLFEVAMYAPQWIDLIEEYLGIEGMKSGCYYFMAHTAESISDKREAIIAKYTPLTKEELNGGCFDVRWFFEVYETLGEKIFDKLYKSAKYSSAGNKHTRARKYADAALGKMDIAETENIITEKRNKDLLMALAVIPSKCKADILQRYEFIQTFLKESKQFGAQRRASEGEACAYALKNLAVTAGFRDETRLTLSMETAFVQENSGYFETTKIEGYDVKIVVDPFGKADVSIEKEGKKLKTIPAPLKKDPHFLSVKEFCGKLRQQYSRTVRMFETAMEERDLFTFGELKLLGENPVTKAITENLVFITDGDAFISGLMTENGLSDQNGDVHSVSDKTALRVAHPSDLYKKGIWSDYQKRLLMIGNSEGRKQPFRQVFRELYVKLPEELNKDCSLMFAGYQIQTKRTIGALKGRRWVADYEDGLQKIYYKDNIIASIYAQADWFSPADIEAPTLECVIFADRKNGKALSISEVPDIIYSEIMRDVDLAVSVAHAGGVDPETTHSTVEMRRVILTFNLALFGIKNVRFEKNHALIDGKYGTYSIHLGSGVIHKLGGHQINVLAVSSGKKSKLFLPFIDEDPKTAEIMTKVLTFAEDSKIKDPFIMEQIVTKN